MIPFSCPKCGLPTVILGGGLGWGCSDPHCIGWAGDSQYQTPEQEAEELRKYDAQQTDGTHEVIGKTWKCDPEYAVTKFLKWARDFRLNNKPRKGELVCLV